MSPFVIGLFLVAGSVALFARALLADPVPRISKGRRLGEPVEEESILKVVYRVVVDAVDSVLSTKGNLVPIRSSELEDADIEMPMGAVVSWLILACFAMFGIGTLLFGGPIAGIFFVIATLVAGKVMLRYRSGARRRKFTKQLDNTLRIIASALRAGQSLSIALNSVAADSEPPMSEEITRVINENRLGRDLVEALKDTADRMSNEDLLWFAEAVEVQRESGGNLNEIIDTVAETIRERAEVREKIRAHAAEGKASAYVLMGLPVGLGFLYTIMNPGYIDPLFTTTIGRLLLLLSGVLYVISWFWMRAIIDIKV